MDTRRRWITILSVLGIAVSGYLTYIHFSGQPIYCGGSSSCELVNSSRFAFILNIPVAMLGLGGYVAIFFLSWIKTDEDRLWPAQAIFGLSLIGALFQWYLFYIEVAKLYAICYWCIASQITITLIFVLALPRRTTAVE